ncbi:MAG: endonuclease III [Methanomassiliicoccales archaeon]|nr:endonuclease III [Methanomassiliicoccales archaeon]
MSWETDPFRVLISTVLSQRTKDENTSVASRRLFSRFDTPKALANAPVDEIRSLIRPAGFPAAKSKAVKEISRIIHEDYGDEVPSNVESLLALPLVGRKTANCVLVYGFDLDAIPVDTHVHRVSNRIGLVKTMNPEETERRLVQIVPRDLWKIVNTSFVAFGKTICRPVGPKCGECPVNKYCDYYSTVFQKK